MKVFAHLWCSVVPSSIPGCSQTFGFQSFALSHHADIWKQALYRKKEPNSGVGWRDRKWEGKSRDTTDKVQLPTAVGETVQTSCFSQSDILRTCVFMATVDFIDLIFSKVYFNMWPLNVSRSSEVRRVFWLTSFLITDHKHLNSDSVSCNNVKGRFCSFSLIFHSHMSVPPREQLIKV